MEHKNLSFKDITINFITVNQKNGILFKPNNQPRLFSFENELSQQQKKLLDESRKKWFYRLILRSINERDFKPLFFDKDCRPNAPINVLVSAIILKEIKDWNYNELIDLK